MTVVCHDDKVGSEPDKEQAGRGRSGEEGWKTGEISLLPLGELLFFDFRRLVHRRRLALHLKGCRGRRVALGQPS